MTAIVSLELSNKECLSIILSLGFIPCKTKHLILWKANVRQFSLVIEIKV